MLTVHFSGRREFDNIGPAVNADTAECPTVFVGAI